MAAHDLAKPVNKSTMDGTLPNGGDVFAPDNTSSGRATANRRTNRKHRR